MAAKLTFDPSFGRRVCSVERRGPFRLVVIGDRSGLLDRDELAFELGNLIAVVDFAFRCGLDQLLDLRFLLAEKILHGKQHGRLIKDLVVKKVVEVILKNLTRIEHWKFRLRVRVRVRVLLNRHQGRRLRQVLRLLLNRPRGNLTLRQVLLRQEA